MGVVWKEICYACSAAVLSYMHGGEWMRYDAAKYARHCPGSVQRSAEVAYSVGLYSAHTSVTEYFHILIQTLQLQQQEILIEIIWVGYTQDIC